MNSKKVTIGIIGGAGYTAGELLRILVYHPNVEIAYAHSESQAGLPVSSIHKDLEGEIDLLFTDTIAETDAVFLCRGHGASKTFLENNELPGNPKVIDLSHDYRIKDNGNDFVYGLPEAFKNDISQSNKVANPGCFATCIQLGLLPLAAARQLNKDIHVTAITGSTGAGQSLTSTSHFSWRNNNLSAYKPFQHQHLAEINQTLNELSGDSQNISFVPVRGGFTRGIFASIYMDTTMTANEVSELYRDYYKEAAFTRTTADNPDLKQVLGTNKGVVYAEKIDGKLLIISMIDNLIKGASGQAIQNMNLMFGLDETAGLKLKSIAF